MNDEALLKQFDTTLLADESNVAAIVIRERLRPVLGPRSVFFPPTFAGIGQGGKSNYHFNEIGPRANDPEGAARDGLTANRFTVDSVPSQANRLETRLLRYSGTRIPKVTISGSRVGQPPLDLLEVGHRIGDAVLRYTADNGFQPFERALRALVLGDAEPMAQIAPTSLVFGHWDSRGETKSKSRRLVRSEIVAYNVARVTKRSQYWSSIDPEVSEELGQILKDAKEDARQNPETKNPASQLGMTDIPAPQSPGGVIAFGAIERTSIIALSGLRALAASDTPIKKDAPIGPTDELNTTAVIEAGANAANATPSEPVSQASINPDRTLAMRRYLFALALAAVADPGVWDLREGCILVRNGGPPTGDLDEGHSAFDSVLVYYNGEEKPFDPPNNVATYLEKASAAFFGTSFPNERRLEFDPAGAKAAIDEKRGGQSMTPKTKKPKTKPELVTALTSFPKYADREAEFKKRSWTIKKLSELWQSEQTAGSDEENVTGDAQNDSTGSET